MDVNTLLIVFFTALGGGSLLIVTLTVLFYVKCVKPELNTMKKTPEKKKTIVSPPMASLPFMMSNAGSALHPSPLSPSASYIAPIKRDANCFTYSGPLQQLSTVDRNIIYSISNSLAGKYPESKHYSSVALPGVGPENTYSHVGLSKLSRGTEQQIGEARDSNETIYARIKSPPPLPHREDYTRMHAPTPILCSSPQEQYAGVQSPPSFVPREGNNRMQPPTPRTHREESIRRQTATPLPCRQDSMRMQTATPLPLRQEFVRMQTTTLRRQESMQMQTATPLPLRQEYIHIQPSPPRTHRNEYTRMHPPTPRTPRTPLEEYASMQVNFPFPNDVEYTSMQSPLSSSGRGDQPRTDNMDESEIELGGSAASILGSEERNSRGFDRSQVNVEVGNCALQGGSLHRASPPGHCKSTFKVARSETIPRGAVKTLINTAPEHLGAQQKLHQSGSGEDGKSLHRGLSRITSKPFFRSSFRGKQSCLPATSEFTFETYRIADYSFPASPPSIPSPIKSLKNRHSGQSFTSKLATESLANESFVSSFYSGHPLNQTGDTSVAIERVAHTTIARGEPTYASIKRTGVRKSHRVCKIVETPTIHQPSLRRETRDNIVDSKELNRISCLSEISCIPKSSTFDHSYSSMSVPGTSYDSNSSLRRISETQTSVSTSLAVHDTSPVSDLELVWMRTSSPASTIFENTLEASTTLVSSLRGETLLNQEQNSQSNGQRMSIPLSDISEAAQKIARCKNVVRSHQKKANDSSTRVSGSRFETKEQPSEPVAEGRERLEPVDTSTLRPRKNDRSGHASSAKGLPSAKIASSSQARAPAVPSSTTSKADQEGASKPGSSSDLKEVVEDDISNPSDCEDVFRNMNNATQVTHL